MNKKNPKDLTKRVEELESLVVSLLYRMAFLNIGSYHVHEVDELPITKRVRRLNGQKES